MSLQLLDLPTEILFQVANELSSPELRSLRLVCQQLDQVAFNLVARRDFTPLKIESTHDDYRRLCILSESVRVSRCIKSLRIVYENHPTDRSTRDFENENFLDDIRRASTALELESLHLDGAYLTRKLLQSTLFASSATLHTLHIHNAKLLDAKWTSVFADMVGVGKFPRLRSFRVKDAREWGRSWFGNCVHFSALAELPLAPGEEDHGPGHCILRTDRRLLGALVNPIEICYSRSAVGTFVSSVAYCGPDVDRLLPILVDTAFIW